MGFDRSHIDVGDYLEALDMRNVSKATESEWRFSCPYPNHLNGDENASAYMNDRTSTFYCHGCKERGDGVSFAAYVLEISHMEAVRLLRQRYQPGYVNPDARNMVDEVRAVLERNDIESHINSNEPIPEDTLENFAVDWERVAKYPLRAPAELRYMLGRGFAPATLEQWEFGYHQGTDRITFGIRDDQGRLIGIKGRAWQKDREPKYLVLGDVPGRPQRYGFSRYSTGLVVYGAQVASKDQDNIFRRRHKVRTAIICEGELNAVALWQVGYQNAVAVNGSNFTREQAKIIVRHFDNAIIFFDSDKAGYEGTWGHFTSSGEWKSGIVEKLINHITVSVVPEHNDDPAKMIQDDNVDYLHWCIDAAKSSTKIFLERL